MTERDLNEMGVRNSAHRARMISSLVMLREKLNRTFRGKDGNSIFICFFFILHNQLLEVSITVIKCTILCVIYMAVILT